jgi:RNA polymerase sigma-70 factor (ECF subfamily)
MVQLLTALRVQDPTTAGPLWQHYAPVVFRMLRRTLGPQAAIDHAVQLVLLHVFRLGRRLGPRADLNQFVLRMIARVANAELRKRRLRWLSSGVPRRAAPKTAAREAPDPERQAMLRFYRILDRLSARDRITFVFLTIERLDARDVAAALGISSERLDHRFRRSLDKVIAGIERDPMLREIAGT